MSGSDPGAHGADTGCADTGCPDTDCPDTDCPDTDCPEATFGGGNARRLVPTELAALAAGVTTATIRKWASRGRLTRYGTLRRALYDLDELLRLME